MGKEKFKNPEFMNSIRLSEQDIYICYISTFDSPFKTQHKLISRGTLLVLVYMEGNYEEDSSFFSTLMDFFSIKQQSSGTLLIDRWSKGPLPGGKKVYGLLAPHIKRDKGVQLLESDCNAHGEMMRLVEKPSSDWRPIENRYVWHALYPLPCDDRLRILGTSTNLLLAATPKHAIRRADAIIAHPYKRPKEVMQVVDRVDTMGDGGFETHFKLQVVC